MQTLLELWSREDPTSNELDLWRLRPATIQPARRLSAERLVEVSRQMTMDWVEIPLPSWREVIALEREIGGRADTELREGCRLRIYAPDPGIDR